MNTLTNFERVAECKDAVAKVMLMNGGESLATIEGSNPSALTNFASGGVDAEHSATHGKPANNVRASDLSRVKQSDTDCGRYAGLAPGPLANNLAAVIESEVMTSDTTNGVSAPTPVAEDNSKLPAQFSDPGWPSVRLVDRSTFNNGQMICV